jgi:hypothetical protein
VRRRANLILIRIPIDAEFVPVEPNYTTRREGLSKKLATWVARKKFERKPKQSERIQSERFRTRGRTLKIKMRSKIQEFIRQRATGES